MQTKKKKKDTSSFVRLDGDGCGTGRRHRVAATISVK